MLIKNHADQEPPSRRSRGTDEIFTFDPTQVQVLGFTIRNQVDLKQFGTVGHVAI